MRRILRRIGVRQYTGSAGIKGERGLKKRTVSILLAAVMVSAALAGCGTSEGDGNESGSASASSEGTAAETAESTADETTADSGTVLNIQCWNDEFRTLLEEHYPGYERVDDTTGKIGEVTVRFVITPTDDNAYQNNLDSVLKGNADAGEENKVDLFLVDADCAVKYANADANYAMKLSDLGITDEDLAQQYTYTKDLVTDSNGDIRGAAWEACSAGLIYNRAIAKTVLGSDDPSVVQEAVKDWESLAQTATALKASGYSITASANDMYLAYVGGRSAAWVDDSGSVQVDESLQQWAESSKALVDAKETGTSILWSDEWNKGFYEDTPVFAYLGSDWMIQSAMHAEEEDSIASNGGWGLTEGPQSYYWGGTWILAATGTDNPNLVKNIILTLTTDAEVMKEIAVSDAESVNNKEVLAELAEDESAGWEILGGQNPYSVFAANAETVDVSDRTVYDEGCTEQFQLAMKSYLDGNASYEEALQQFYEAIAEQYPELTTK